MKIYIFDIDGTLTSTNPDLIKTAGYSTHAFWDLLTYPHVIDEAILKQEIAAWRETVKYLDKKTFITSSADIMQKALLQTSLDLSEQQIIHCAQDITENFIRSGVVIQEAIRFLNDKAEEGHLCILSTGSYQSGATGFLNALVNAKLISRNALDYIMISGAIVDWQKKQLIHANVHNNKIKGVNHLLQTRFGFDLPHEEHEVYVYADDPKGNDFGILSLTTPDKRFVIAHEANHDSEDGQYLRMLWGEIVAIEAQYTIFKPN